MHSGVRAAPAATAQCSRETALEVGKPFFFDPGMSNPIGQVLCGPFAGPGSEAMAVSFTAPTCWGLQRWAIFRFTGGAWRVALDQRAFIFPLVVVGADIRERRPVSRSGDPRCIPSGGSHARTWHWDGTAFKAGPWKQVTPPQGGGSATGIGYFKTPSSNIVCVYVVGKNANPPLVACGIRSGLKPPPPRRRCAYGDPVADRVSLLATGRTQVPSCAGDPGPFVGLTVGARVVGYGKSWSGSGLRCTSAFSGLTCRNRSGHGFFLSRSRWRRF
jgi:hypothetical protein